MKAIELPGKRQPKVTSPIQEGQDKFHVFEALCIDLADTLGYDSNEVCAFWSQVALAREWAGEPRAWAEWAAFEDTRFALDRRGAQPD